TTIAWHHVKSIERLDGRHLILVLPSPLPRELRGSELPFEELRQSSAEAIPPEGTPPERYGFILHEQELGRALPDAEGELRRRLSAAQTGGVGVAQRFRGQPRAAAGLTPPLVPSWWSDAPARSGRFPGEPPL